MNNEIKEILDRLERIDHKEYSCGFEFADSGSFDEDCRCFEERKKMANYITNLQQENKQLKDLIDTILNFSLFKEECPLNFGFDNNTNEDKSQSIFYEDQWCENNCNDNYKDCWLKYFKKFQELEQGSDSNVKNKR